MKPRHTLGTITHAATSDDANYNGITIANVVANITDNDTPGVTITESGGSTAVNEENETTDTYTVKLNSQPAANVVITLTPDNQVKLNTTTLTFTPINWNTPQTITDMAVDDAVHEATPHPGTITHAAMSDDANYNGITIAKVTANITDNDTPDVTITESGGSTAVNEENETSDTYTVKLNSQPTANVVITLTPDSQVKLNTTTLTFTLINWNTPQTVTVTAVDDTLAEGTHTSTVTHTTTSNDANYTGITIAKVTANITDNDDTSGTITLSINTATMPESSGSITLTAKTDKVISHPITITLTLIGTATMGKDYTLPSTMLVIPANETTKTLVIQAQDDPMDEPNETLIISTTHIANGFIGTPARVIATILDDDDPPIIAPEVGDQSVCEEGGTIPITMKLTQMSGKPITLTVGTIPATTDSPFAAPALPNQDYIPIQTTLVITPENPTSIVHIPIIPNEEHMVDRVFWVGLLRADNALIGKDDMAQVTILDSPCDYARVRFSSRQYNGAETDGTIPVTITVSSPQSSPVTVRYLTRSGSANYGNDYALSSDEITIPAGKSSYPFSIPIINDTDSEGTESFFLTLTTITQGQAKISIPNETEISILDNDLPTAGIIRVETTNVRGGEAEGQREVEVIVVREGGDGRTVRVPYSTLPGTASAGWDYVPITDGILTFDQDHPRQSILLSILDDTGIEGEERFSVTLGTPTNGATLGSQGKATIIIEDDDVETAPYGIVEFTTNEAVVSEAAGMLTLQVKRTGFLSTSVTVGIDAFNESAKTPNDYQVITHTLTFTEGISTQPINLYIIPNNAAEGNKTFQVVITTVSAGASIGTQDRVMVTIEDDDTDDDYPSGIVQFKYPTMSSYEPDEPTFIEIPIYRNSMVGEVKVEVKTHELPFGALPGSDYETTQQTIIFAEGQTTQVITVSLLPDTKHEPNEQFLVQLAIDKTYTKAKVGINHRLYVTIVDNDLPPKGSVSFMYPAYQVNENRPSITIDVQWHKPTEYTGEEIQVTYETVEDTAKPNVHYIHQQGILTFTTENRQVFIVPILDNTISDGHKTVLLRLRDKDEDHKVVPNGQQDVFLTIQDDEPIVSQVAFSQAKYIGHTTDPYIPITVERTGQVSETVTVTYSTYGGSAQPGVHYQPISGTLTFSPTVTQQSFFIPLRDATIFDKDENVFVRLDETIGNVTPGSLYQAEVLLQHINQDVQFVQSETINNEGSSPAYVYVQRAGPTDQEVKVDFTTQTESYTQTGTAIPGKDYSPVSGTLTFAKNSSSARIDIPIIDDAEVEDRETVLIYLTKPVGARLGNRTSTTLTIIDNDKPTLMFATSTYEFLEAVESAPITVTLNKKSYAPITATCRVVTTTFFPEKEDHGLVVDPGLIDKPTQITFAPNSTTAVCSLPFTDTNKNASRYEQAHTKIEVSIADAPQAILRDDSNQYALTTQTNSDSIKRSIIIWDDDGPDAMSIVASPQQVLANGQDTITATVLVTDTHGNPLTNQPVTLDLTPQPHDWQSQKQTTNEKGMATFPLTLTHKNEGEYILQANDGIHTKTTPAKFGLVHLALPTVTKPGLPMPVQVRVQATPNILGPSCTEQTVYITATVLQQNMFKTSVVTQEQVILTTTQGTFGISKTNSIILTTNDRGEVTTTWHPGGAKSSSTITAQVDSTQVKGTGTTEVRIAEAPTTMQMSTNNVYLAQGSWSEITAQLYDAHGMPVPCETVTFTTTLGTLDLLEGQTDQNGQAPTVFNCNDKPGSVTITGKTSTITQTIHIVCIDLDKLIITASPTQIEAQKGQQSTLTITAQDATGQSIPQQQVVLSTTLGIITPNVVQTDANGQAVVTLAPSAELALGTATVRAITGYPFTISQTIELAITPLLLELNATNKVPSKAQQLEIDTAYRVKEGLLQGKSNDYYTLSAKANGYVQFFLREIPEGADYDLKIANAKDMVMIGESQESGSSDEKITVLLKSGETYYIQVSRTQLAAEQHPETSYVIGTVRK